MSVGNMQISGDRCGEMAAGGVPASAAQCKTPAVSERFIGMAAAAPMSAQEGQAASAQRPSGSTTDVARPRFTASSKASNDTGF